MMGGNASYAALIDDRPEEGVFRIDRSIDNDPAILEAAYRNCTPSALVR